MKECIYKTDDGLCVKDGTEEVHEYCVEGPCRDEVIAEGVKLYFSTDDMQARIEGEPEMVQAGLSCLVKAVAEGMEISPMRLATRLFMSQTAVTGEKWENVMYEITLILTWLADRCGMSALGLAAMLTMAASELEERKEQDGQVIKDGVIDISRFRS